MCGIAGFVGRSGRGIERAQIEIMTQSIRHRGPNDAGLLMMQFETGEFELSRPGGGGTMENASLGFGHRRLSIIDLSTAGWQPMSDPTRKVWIVYNGELYNYIEIRAELEKAGVTFHSSSDTEVLLAAYIHWGLDAFTKFNGMWALAIADLRSKSVIFSRDRFGKKPLYYHKTSNGIYFASEIKALLTQSDIPKRMNFTKISNYAGRHYRLVDNDAESYFEGINQIPKGTTVVYRNDILEEPRRYWRLEARPLLTERFKEGEIVEQFRELLESAVKLRLRSDVPVGCMLSGGMDSTSITALAALAGSDFTAFSGVTGEGYYNESEYIDEMIKHTGVKGRYVRPKAVEVVPTLREMLRFHDEPVCTVTWFSLYLIAREIANAGITVILTGHGGDELLAGYWDHYHFNFLDLRNSGGDDAERRAWLETHRRDPAEYDREKTYAEAFMRDTARAESERWSGYIGALAPAMKNHLREPAFDSLFSTALSRKLGVDLIDEAISPSLRAEDRNTMAFSVEARVPFLDYRLVDFSFRLPNEYKIRGGLGKWLLREAMKGILPEKVRMRRDKTGFNAPADVWFRNELRPELERMIETSGPVNELIYDRAETKKLFDRHQKGENHYMFFWQYLNMHLWHEEFFG